MKYSSELTVIVPVYNELEGLPSFAPRIIEYCLARNWQLIFINDGSEDDSGKYLEGICSDSRVKVLHHKINRGYGRAIKTGISNATTPYLVTIDSDGQHEISDVEEIFNFALANNADMVVGDRGAKVNRDIYRALGKRIIHAFTRILMPLPIHDLNSGFKFYRADLALRYQRVCPDAMSFSDVITLVFIHQRSLVLQYPIQTNPRKSGKSTINTYTAAQTVLEILNIILMFNPLRIFLPLSFLFVFAGLTWGALVYMINGSGLSVGAMLSIVMGLILAVLGLLANQISSMRMERLEE